MVFSCGLGFSLLTVSGFQEGVSQESMFQEVGEKKLPGQLRAMPRTGMALLLLDSIGQKQSQIPFRFKTVEKLNYTFWWERDKVTLQKRVGMGDTVAHISGKYNQPLVQWDIQSYTGFHTSQTSGLGVWSSAVQTFCPHLIPLHAMLQLYYFPSFLYSYSEFWYFFCTKCSFSQFFPLKPLPHYRSLSSKITSSGTPSLTNTWLCLYPP